MSDQEEFERCKTLVTDFCDWVLERNQRLQAELREMRARHQREADARVAKILSDAGRTA